MLRDHPPSWSIELMFLICHTLSRVCPCLQISSAGRVEAVNSIEHYLCMLCHFLYPWNLSNNVEIWDSHGDHVGFTKGSRDFPADSSCGGVFGPAGCGTQRKGRSRSNFFCPLGSMITRFVCRMLPSMGYFVNWWYMRAFYEETLGSGVPICRNLPLFYTIGVLCVDTLQMDVGNARRIPRLFCASNLKWTHRQEKIDSKHFPNHSWHFLQGRSSCIMYITLSNLGTPAEQHSAAHGLVDMVFLLCFP